MAQNGLDIDTLKDGNTDAVAMIQNYQGILNQIGTIPGYEGIIDKLKSELNASADQIVALLNANNAAISGTESYLDGVSEEVPKLTQGLADLKIQYETFDGSINQLVDSLGNMAGNLSELSGGINQLVEEYEALDPGINDYTDGVAYIVAGYTQVMSGVSSLAEGSRTLADGSGELYDGTAELYDGVIELCDGAKEMADGTGEFKSETSNLDEQLDKKIDTLLESVGGSTDNPVSFVSDKNGNVESVQFVIQTEAIKKKEAEDTEAETKEETTIADKFIELFN